MTSERVVIPTDQRIVRDETRSVRTVTSVGPVDGSPLGTFGWFMGVRGRGGRDTTADRKRYERCAICRAPFGDDDPVHMVFNVQRNGKTVGNRLACGGCASKYETHRSGVVRRDS